RIGVERFLDLTLEIEHEPLRHLREGVPDPLVRPSNLEVKEFLAWGYAARRGIGDRVFHVLDAGIDRVVVVGVIGDELLQPKEASASKRTAATHHGVAAALDELVALLVAIETVDGNGNVVLHKI